MKPKNQKPSKTAALADDEDSGALPIGMQKTREVSVDEIEKEEDEDTFSPMGTGRVDTDEIPDIHNPAGVQGGRGPLNQEGEGNRQNDEAAELEEIEPDLEKRFKSPR